MSVRNSFYFSFGKDFNSRDIVLYLFFITTSLN